MPMNGQTLQDIRGESFIMTGGMAESYDLLAESYDLLLFRCPLLDVSHFVAGWPPPKKRPIREINNTLQSMEFFLIGS